MKNLELNYKGILKYVSEKEIAAYEENTKHALKQLIDNTGLGSDFTGWVNYPFEIQEKEMNDICELANKIRSNSQCLVVIGIGGSYLGAKAAIEMFTPYFSNNSFDVIFLGNNMSSGYIDGVLKYLRTVDFSVNVISKSGKTLEPAIAFRLVKNLMLEKVALKAEIISPNGVILSGTITLDLKEYQSIGSNTSKAGNYKSPIKTQKKETVKSVLADVGLKILYN